MASKGRWMLTALSVMLVLVFGGTAVMAQVNQFGLDEDDVISRGDFVLMVYNALNQPESTTECPVKGLSKEETQALSALMDIGAYKGLEPLPEQGYDSTEPIPRDEMLGVLANVFQLMEKSPEAQNALKNGATPGEWALYAVQNGLNQKKEELTFVLNLRTQDDVLDPASLTNEQAAELIEELLPKASQPRAISGPSVKITPKTLTVSEGDKASITVKATSNGTLSYQWYKNGARLSSEKKKTLTISAAQLADSGRYYCKVTAKLDGRTSTKNSGKATLTVLTLPDATISAPGKVTFNTDFHASVPDQAGVTYEWSVEDGTITSGSGTNQISVSVGGSASTITLHCTVINGAGASAADARTVHAYPAPNAEVSAPNSANVGDSVQVSVPFQPGCEYNWTINMESYTLNDHGNGTIEITPFETGHLIVGCTVVNPAGDAASGTSTTIVS